MASKVRNAFYPAKVVDGNPVLEYAKYIIFRKSPTLSIERRANYGGTIEFASYETLEQAFRKGELHPADLKKGIAAALDSVVAPIRSHFEKDPAAKRMYEAVKTAEVTR